MLTTKDLINFYANFAIIFIFFAPLACCWCLYLNSFFCNHLLLLVNIKCNKKCSTLIDSSIFLASPPHSLLPCSFVQLWVHVLLFPIFSLFFIKTTCVNCNWSSMDSSHKIMLWGTNDGVKQMKIIFSLHFLGCTQITSFM